VTLTFELRGLEQEIAFVRLKQNRHVVAGYAQADEDLDEIMKCYRRIQNLLERLALNANVNVWMKVDEQATNYRLDKLAPSHAAWYNSQESKDIQRDECTPNTRVEVLERFKVWREDDTVEKIYWLNGMAGTVIEALDECENSSYIGEILDLLFLHVSDLPVKFFLTSRPEPEIRRRMCQRSGDRKRFELHLHDLNQSIVQDDIRKYLEVGLKPAKISPEDLQTLVERAGTLFIYAATIVRFVGDFGFSRSFERLPQILRATTLSEGSDRDINELYRLILDQAINNPRLVTREKEEMVLVLRTVICAQEPMTAGTLSTILGLGGEISVNVAVNPLRSVLNIQQADEGISTLHKSFSDYLFDPNRASEFYCDPAKHNQVIAQQCFRLIKTSNPPFNICRLASSFVFDKDVPHLSEAIGQHISGGLLYACRYWGAHLELAKDSQHLLGDIYGLLSRRLLLWMEVLNLTGYLQPDGVNLLSRVTEMIKKFPTNEWFKPVLELATDACQFAHTFASSPASQSTPHIYISALRFWPKERPVSECYSQSIQYSMLDTCRSDKPSVPVPIYAISGRVLSSAFSPDGSRGVSGSADGMVYLWNAQSGATFGPPLNGHTDAVHSVAFSPDGAYIVSGSEDHTIRIWNAHTGQPVGRLLEGHTAAVHSVAYSPDGAYIFSGSGDGTIRVWDARTGEQVGRPLEGHTAAVHSVAYSPDGAYAVSGSGDRTVRIWDARAGEQVRRPLEGHTAAVHSVAYSPDGALIFSGSGDGTIRVWDAITGEQRGQPLEEHTAAVHSVAHSPDGAYVVSGSGDGTIRVWDARTGERVGRPLEGHTAAVHSVAYSPDGAYVVSGSGDRTVRVWDAALGQLKATPLGDHRAVHFVKCIRTTAGNFYWPLHGIARTWDAEQGQLVNCTQTTPNDQTAIVRRQDTPPGGYPDNASHPSCLMCQGSVRQFPGNLFVEDILTTASGGHTGLCEISSSEHPTAPAPMSLNASNYAPEIAIPICCSWAFDEEGWIATCSWENVLWVPPHARDRIQHPIELSSIPTKETLLIDFESILVGERWALCYCGPQGVDALGTMEEFSDARHEDT
ncbi:hypothetical protein FRC07_008073, partial [Ceratobasidium sp. 392]